MKQVIIILLLLLLALLLVIAFQGIAQGTDNDYFKSYINTDIIGGYVD